MATQYTKTLEQQERRVRVIFVGSYIPRKCGIATFTKDLTNAINVLNPYNLGEIMAINDNTNTYDYPWEVKFRINQDDLKTYISAAEYINNSSAEIVCFQHEFGLFGGKNGEYAIPFLEQIKKPIVTTFHSVPEEPLEAQKEIICRICSLSSACVVMINSIVERLISVYGVDRKKLVVIPHGVPDIPFGATEHFKRQLRLGRRFILNSTNLVSANKGIEFAIEAIPAVVKEIPRFLYLVVGETHPVVKRIHGEEYRKKLESIVKKLRIKRHVKFVNRYVTLEELISYLRASDIYITPYSDPGQVASGTLSYAVGAGKACISTPYLYAREVLGDERGVLVPFNDAASIAKAIVNFYKETKFRGQMERRAYDYGRLMIWPSVALGYLDLFKLVLQKTKVRAT
jgi:glycosyltransferase involved in cell wall biosynthesis